MTTAIQTSPSEFVTLSALITVMTEASLKSSTWQPFIISKIHRMTYTNIQSVFDKSGHQGCIYLIKYTVIRIFDSHNSSLIDCLIFNNYGLIFL